MFGTANPQVSRISSAVTTITARSPWFAGSTAGKRATSAGNRGSSRKTGSPRPWTRTMFGGPENAHHISVMRPFSRRWAMVSALLPAKSRYATVRSSRTAREPVRPFGERLTVPSPESGAVAVKKMCCSSMNVLRRPAMRVYV